MPCIYNSRDARYKRPFGALRAGELMEMKLRVPEGYGCETPYLFIKPDGGEAKQLPLAKTGQEDGEDLFAVELTLDAPGLYFYYFDLWTGYRKLFCGAAGEARESTEEGRWYQLTVYDANYKTPEEIHGGVMYQIFPDRFFEGDPDKPMNYNERIYRADKTKEPYFWPTEQRTGYITKDYFGGDLLGIKKRLPFLYTLGVNWLYLNPIFEAHSNHRYNTADYLKVDPYLGTNEDFADLCAAAKAFGIRIILDGVFSHTGSDSIYFNREGRYPTYGAWQGPESPYREWYIFKEGGDYESWWGFKTLPTCDKNNPAFRQFICGEGGVVDSWMKLGASGFRLDVADELPDDFIADIRHAVKRHGEDKLLIGEVWEDASNKISYEVRRKYFWGGELDGVMNYPFRTAVLEFLKTTDAVEFQRQVMTVAENYPAPALAACTTHLSSHDTVRAITELAGDPLDGQDRNWQSGRRLNAEQYHLGMVRMKLAFVLQFTLPGVPCVYYGDEIAMQGYKDPFNRGYYDWHSGETSLIKLTRDLALTRKNSEAFKGTRIRFLCAKDGLLHFERWNGEAKAQIAVNCSGHPVELDMLGEKVQLNNMSWEITTNTEAPFNRSHWG